MTLSTAEREEERRRGRLAGSAVIGAALLIAAGIIWGARVNSDRPDRGDARRLSFFHDHASELIAATSLSAVGFLLLVFAVVHLQRSTRARNPQLPSLPLIVGLFGAIVLALASAGHSIALASEAADFVTQDFPLQKAANEAAKDAAREPLPLATGVLVGAGTIALAFWFVLGSLYGMRVGLLTRFMGTMGIIVGPGFILGFAPLMVFWLIAAGILFLGYWPRGLPPAWEAGEARPWPGRERPQDAVPEEVEATGSSRTGEGAAVGPGVRGPGSGGQPEQPSATPRRKRKRRQ